MEQSDDRYLLSSYDYRLPRELIAQEPAEPRDSSRLMVCDIEEGIVEHRIFREIEEILSPNDILVLNNTKVIPARVRGRKPTGGKVEVLFLNPHEESAPLQALIKGKVREGSTVEIPVPEMQGKTVRVNIRRHIREGRFEVEVEGVEDILGFLSTLGEMPVPPYIRKPLDRKEKYQTVFSREPGSVAAPTAGLHFTTELLSRLGRKGIRVLTLTLHVSIGTFLPVRENDIRRHNMEPEYFILGPEIAEVIEAGEELTAVGTTVVKALESAFHLSDKGGPEGLKTEGWSNLFIYPGHRFLSPLKGMVTNFHLPASTLIMLVSAYAGRKSILRFYELAVKERYRFYSFGDAMFLKGKPVAQP